MAQTLLRLVHNDDSPGRWWYRRVSARNPITSGVGGDGGDTAAPGPSREQFDKLVSAVAELDRRITEARKDIDMQFQRLAELQAVIDRMQIAARNRKARTND